MNIISYRKSGVTAAATLRGICAGSPSPSPVCVFRPPNVLTGLSEAGYATCATTRERELFGIGRELASQWGAASAPPTILAGHPVITADDSVQ